MSSVEETLAKYSTPNLRRNQLTRGEKKFRLEMEGYKPADVKKILDELYGAE